MTRFSLRKVAKQRLNFVSLAFEGEIDLTLSYSAKISFQIIKFICILLEQIVLVAFLLGMIVSKVIIDSSTYGTK